MTMPTAGSRAILESLGLVPVINATGFPMLRLYRLIAAMSAKAPLPPLADKEPGARHRTLCAGGV
jgi:hypothetical protein